MNLLPFVMHNLLMLMARVKIAKDQKRKREREKILLDLSMVELVTISLTTLPETTDELNVSSCKKNILAFSPYQMILSLSHSMHLADLANEVLQLCQLQQWRT